MNHADIFTFGLAVLAEKWWIKNDAVKGSFQFNRELSRLLKVVSYKFLEHIEALVKFE